ncbi:50S ribosomal protein L10 [Haloplasma contractile]|uniref:Large ribosomal subunit protein uL10 n=1 Tax=Haloplasma contractile SSD-17B TaxID=1033810 RepID=U2EBD1_9MOLU|nr:50S ribosomal protein L10 [Haloplasma contractile]ERJ12398.1 50S ribosomal protein L10 [Haloplasma contractile SSD-17B]
MSSAVIESKIKLVDQVTEKFENSLSCVVVDYRGLTVEEVTELRKKLREEGIEFKVIKNNISRRAANQAGFEGLSDLFTGPNAIAFSENDAVAPARILHDFAKDHEELELKGGFIEKNIASIEQIKEVAALPNRDGMLSMLLSVLQAPIRNFAYAVKAISEKDGEEVEENDAE